MQKIVCLMLLLTLMCLQDIPVSLRDDTRDEVIGDLTKLYEHVRCHNASRSTASGCDFTPPLYPRADHRRVHCFVQMTQIFIVSC
jgi:hypothetical protein